jgi:hypothetical protein
MTVADGSQLPRHRIILEKGKRTAWGTVFWRGWAAYRIAAQDAGISLRGDPLDVFDIHVPALYRDPEAASALRRVRRTCTRFRATIRRSKPGVAGRRRALRGRCMARTCTQEPFSTPEAANPLSVASRRAQMTHTALVAKDSPLWREARVGQDYSTRPRGGISGIKTGFGPAIAHSGVARC